jgi:hypothetical protein
MGCADNVVRHYVVSACVTLHGVRRQRRPTLCGFCLCSSVHTLKVSWLADVLDSRCSIQDLQAFLELVQQSIRVLRLMLCCVCEGSNAVLCGTPLSGSGRPRATAVIGCSVSGFRLQWDVMARKRRSVWRLCFTMGDRRKGVTDPSCFTRCLATA